VSTISKIPRSIFPRSSIFHHPDPLYHRTTKKPSMAGLFRQSETTLMGGLFFGDPLEIRLHPRLHRG